ncbi:MAG: hypothetical protein RBT36_09060 [Desulfobulbus sp.]|nr:hypothetical protein [Desulfobulbus sp.]
MRFRIKKSQDGVVRTIVVSGTVDEESGWDLLQIAQIMLAMPSCQKLVVDLQGAIIDEEVTVLNSDTLVSVFEERLFVKNCTVVFRYRDGNEIHMQSGLSPLLNPPVFVSVPLGDARLYGRAMRWIEQEARLLAASGS